MKKEKELNQDLPRMFDRPKKTRIELVEDRYTGTLYEMEVSDDTETEKDICPVIREARK
jgi:hypothetical protein